MLFPEKWEVMNGTMQRDLNYRNMIVMMCFLLGQVLQSISTSCFLKIFILKKRKQKTSQRLKNRNIIPKMILKT